MDIKAVWSSYFTRGLKCHTKQRCVASHSTVLYVGSKDKRTGVLYWIVMIEPGCIRYHLYQAGTVSGRHHCSIMALTTNESRLWYYSLTTFKT